MTVRMIKREELLECEKIQSIAFAYSLNTAELEKQLLAEESGPADPYIGYFNEENIITACMELPEYRIRYENQWVKMVGVGGVASLPEYRFGGAVRQILQVALRRMLESGAVFSALYPFSHPYYRQFGYELCHTAREFELPIEALSRFRCTAKARMLRPGESTDGLKTVYDGYFSRYNLAVQREDRHWEKLLGKDPYQERVYSYFLEDESGPSAYVVLAPEEAGPYGKTGKVREIAFAHPRGLTDALGLIYRLAAQYRKIRIPLPDDIPFSSLVEESYQLQSSLAEQPMARVVNVQKALELKPHFEGAAYTLRVRDDGILENDGVFSVRCENGVVTVQKQAKAGTAADLTVDVRTLAQLLLGFLAVDEAKYKEDVEIAGNLETLRCVFRKSPVFLTDHF